MHLASLHIYPVKSLRGFPVESVELDPLGARGDRRFMVVDPAGTFMTQRTEPRMARIGAFLHDGFLELSSDGFGAMRVGAAPDPGAPLATVRIWKSEGLRAEDCGAQAASWLSAAIGSPCRLVRIGPAFVRPVLKAAARPGDTVMFADAVPFLVTTLASLDWLNDRIAGAGGEAVPMDQFRPNMVVAGAGAFAEDGWRRVRIGGVVFRSAGPCARCIISTTDQATGQRGAEPLRTLAAHRRDPSEPTHVNFGQNLVHESKAGTLRVGDAVEILE
jgi:uncharacterized protein YcbX